MLEKEAFALLTKRVWHMLNGNEPIAPTVTDAINRLEPKPFHESAARTVLAAMTKEIGRTVVPALSETDDAFIDAVAFAFVFLAEGDRPTKYDGYTSHTFAEMLIEQFCKAYAKTVSMSTPVKLDIPISSPRALSLRERLRDLKPTAFGQYTLPPRN